jgi:TolA-binding protein
MAIDDLPLDTPGAASDSPLRGEEGPSARDANAATEADIELDAYRAAHRTHFDRNDPSAALAAWDHYLAAFPHGTFAADARFNRALCLIRLGRLVEAHTALVPFAGAVRGSYRQAEAASLLQGLSASVF